MPPVRFASTTSKARAQGGPVAIAEVADEPVNRSTRAVHRRALARRVDRVLSMSTPTTVRAPLSAAAIASTPEPVPRSSTRGPRRSTSDSAASRAASTRDGRCRSPCDGSITITVAVGGGVAGMSHGGATMKRPAVIAVRARCDRAAQSSSETSSVAQLQRGIAPPNRRHRRRRGRWHREEHAPAQRRWRGLRRSEETSGPTGRRAAAALGEILDGERRVVVEHRRQQSSAGGRLERSMTALARASAAGQSPARHPKMSFTLSNRPLSSLVVARRRLELLRGQGGAAVRGASSAPCSASSA